MSTQKDDSPPPRQPATRQNSGGWLVLLLVLPLICGGIGFLAGAVIAYVSPKKYESRALVQVSPERISVDSRGLPELASQQGASFQFLATEVAVITSRATLERVVERLDLAARWNLPPDQVVDLLTGLVTVERIPDTDLLTIRVRHTNAQDARDLAEAVAEAYAARRTERETDRAEQALQALDEELRKQEDVVEEKRKVLDIIVQGGGMTWEGASEGPGAATSRERIDELAEQNFFSLEKEKQQLDIQLGSLGKWSGEDLFKYVAGLNLPQNGAAVLYPEYRSELRELEALVDAGMGDAHPKLVAQSARVDVLAKELEREVASIRELLKSQSKMVNERLARIEKMVGRRRDEAVDRALEHGDYIEAKREYEQEQSMLQSMKLAHSSQRIALRIPTRPVTIHESPRTGLAPVSPKVSLCLAGGALGGAVLGFLMAIFIGMLGLMRRNSGT